MYRSSPLPRLCTGSFSISYSMDVAPYQSPPVTLCFEYQQSGDEESLEAAPQH